MKNKSFERKEELLKAAMEEFSSKSYEEASLNHIIKNAGISKGTFYYHFEDKQALYLYLIQSVADAKVEFMNKKMLDYNKEEGDRNFFENFRIAAKTGIEFVREYPKYYLFGMMYLKEKGNKIYDAAKKMLGNTTENFLEELLDHAIKNGDIREGISREFCLRILSWLWTRYDEIFDVKEEMMDFDLMLRDIDDFIDFMQYGLGNRNNE